MGLTPFDVSNLNASMRGVGDTFAERRQEAMQQQKLDIEEEMRQKMLDAEMRRLELEQGRQNVLSQGTVDTWLQGEDGGTVHFQGPQSGLQTLLQQSEDKGKPLTQLDQPPTSKPQYGVFKTSTPLGDMEFHLSTPEDVDKVTAMAKQMGGKAINHQSEEAGPIQMDKYAADLENQADELDAGQASGPGQYDPTVAAQSARLRERARQVRQGNRVDPTQFQIVTSTAPADPMNPTGARTSVTQRVPMTSPVFGQPGAPVPAPPLDPTKRVPGQSYATPRGVMRWSGTGWSQ